MNKRFLYFMITGLIILLILGGLLFYLSNKQKQEVANGPGPLKIMKVIDEAVISPVPAYNNSSIWYFNSAGHLFSSNIDGSNQSEFPLPAMPSGTLKSALWPLTGPDFITISSTGQGIVKNYFNNKSKIFLSFPTNVQWLDWLPDGLRVLYIWQANDKKTQQLVMANADGTGFKTIANVFWPDLAVKADPSGRTALMYRTSVQGEINKIYAVSLSSGQIITLLDQGKNQSATWLPDGTGFIFSQAVGGGTKIFLYNLASKQVVDFKLSTTLDRVAIDASSRNLYAAVPKSDGSGDTFVKVDLATGATTSHFDPDKNIKVKSLMLVGNIVYYINASDNKLYMISN